MKREALWSEVHASSEYVWGSTCEIFLWAQFSCTLGQQKHVLRCTLLLLMYFLPMFMEADLEEEMNKEKRDANNREGWNKHFWWLVSQTSPQWYNNLKLFNIWRNIFTLKSPSPRPRSWVCFLHSCNVVILHPHKGSERT